MSTKTTSDVRTWADERGQVLLVFALSLVVVIGLMGFVVDVGRVLYAKNVIQASSDAAATAAAQDINVTGLSPTSTATTYSSLAGQKNARSNVPNVAMASGYPMLKCLSSINLPCNAPSNSNAISVKQQVSVPMIFAKVLGINSMLVTAQATAGMKQGGLPPLDIVIVLDTTGSMGGTSCSSSVSGVSSPKKIDCAKAGIRTLLQQLWPCSGLLSSCGAVDGTGNVPSPVDKVGLVIFPPLISSADVANELDCSSNITTSKVAYDNPLNKSVDPNYTYAIVHPSSDFRTSTSAASLNNSSNLVKAVYWTTCASHNTYGVEAPGGVGTSFAVALEKAQSELATYGRAGIQDVIIFVSDGESNYGPVYKDTQASSPETSTYRTRPCQKAIDIADGIAAGGVWVYAIEYDTGLNCQGWNASETFHKSSSGSGGSYFSHNESPALSGSQVMAGVASDSTKYYSQPNPGDLTAIFQKVADTLTTTRLVNIDTP